MPVRIVENPIEDRSWSELLERHSAATIFHSPGWLSALKQTYGFEPFVVTTSPGATLENGLVVCRVNGWRRRLVSLPFSDHCDALVNGPSELSEMLAALAGEVRRDRWRSMEWRPRAVLGQAFESAAHDCGLTPTGQYCLHSLDLRPGMSQIFRRFHPSSTQRAIRRAERERLSYEVGTSHRLLDAFYGLLRMTRRRHGLPPQPMAWFRNLIGSLRDRVAIHLASASGRPVAGILTLAFKRTMFYKYGGSDALVHHLGGMPFLFWRVIQDAQATGFEELDLGRSDVDQPGLIAFKDHLGATRSMLTYYRYAQRHIVAPRRIWITRMARQLFAHLPDAPLDLAGRLLYRHLG